MITDNVNWSGKLSTYRTSAFAFCAIASVLLGSVSPSQAVVAERKTASPAHHTTDAQVELFKEQIRALQTHPMDASDFFLHAKTYASGDRFGERKLTASIGVDSYELVAFASDAQHLPGVAYYERISNPDIRKVMDYQAYVTSFDSEGGDVNTAVYLHGVFADGTTVYLAFDNDAYVGKMVPAFVEHPGKDGYSFIMEDIYRFKHEVQNDGMPLDLSQKEFEDLDISIKFYAEGAVFTRHLPAMIHAVPTDSTKLLFNPGWKDGRDSALECSGDQLYRKLKAVFAQGPVYPDIDNLDHVPTPGRICE